MTSPVDIANLALDEIRARATVTSIFPPDGSLASDVLNRQYLLRVQAVSRAAHWNCLRFQTTPTLSLLKAFPGTPENPNGTSLPSPPNPWLYEYAAPPDMLKARYIVPILPQPNVSPPLTTAGGVIVPPYVRGAAVLFAVATDTNSTGNRVKVILTNMSQAQLVYTSDLSTDPDLWDPQFEAAAVTTLASFVAAPITGKDQLTGLLSARAKELILAARLSDGNEGPQSSDSIPDWLRIRGVGGGLGTVFPSVSAWDGIAFGDGSYLA